MYTVWCASLLLVCVLATTFGDSHGGGVDARRHRRSMLSVRGVADTDGPVVVEKKVLVDADEVAAGDEHSMVTDTQRKHTQT